MENHIDRSAEEFSGLLTSLSSQVPDLYIRGIQLFEGKSLENHHYPVFSSATPVLIRFSEQQKSGSGIVDLLREVYPGDFQLHANYRKSSTEYEWTPLTLSELGTIDYSWNAVYIPALSIDASLESFMDVIAHLRAPDGCPWDRKQTHTSLRPYLLEETYEALEALDKNDITGLREELGDILLQIVLHAQIASENGEFNIGDVISGINRKIVSRHPHVFGEIKVSGESEVVQNWEKIKEGERETNGKDDVNGLLDGIPSILPALSQAQSIQERAARVGFDWPEIAPVLAKVHEELEEVQSAPSDEERAGELGDLLFAVVNYVRWFKVDAESALRTTNQKFRKRFAYIEEKSKSKGKEMRKMSLAEMDALWDEAKKQE